ncbi:Antitoxin component YwqK of the YwqJK toxin-antitoxin module [Robiginitalea myxolifaciens]|uniref:Antitoxin component YwqK of the YwqJK toxin-antitoxin module n=1 Tax=Robiginitalea myxolifaciens TaxID=400055 RepID=A0A1I6HAK0_9FLAO|nr:hypothetical protein [Robiginitalea myxolifaciens]SFR51492.1 Antitoxin component YwqK of the YwqJK toxin-antitoxin module [Robiginitalea myxolifaciens]
MKSIKLLPCLLLCSAYAASQDTIVKNYPETNQRWEIIYEDGKKTKETVYHKSGNSWMTARYDSDNREDWRWYHKNGNLFFKATIIDNKIEGKYQIWYENGQLAEQLNFIAQIENGPAQFYHRNGQLAMRGNYRDGRMTEGWEFFDVNGKPANGTWEWNFAAQPGKRRMMGELKDGKRIGKWDYHTTAMGKEKKRFNEVLE